MPPPARRANDCGAALGQATEETVLLALLVPVEISIVHHAHVCDVVELDDDGLTLANLDFGVQVVHGTTAPRRACFRAGRP